MTGPAIFVGIDVAKSRLDVAPQSGGVLAVGER